MTRQLRTPRGRALGSIGADELITLDRLTRICDLFDADPRVASVSLIHSTVAAQVNTTVSPAGPVTIFAADLNDLCGDPDLDFDEWVTRSRHRGLQHLWLTDSGADVRGCTHERPSHPVDERDAADPITSYRRESPSAQGLLSLVVDATWLGPHQTGAQVLTVEALTALMRHPRVGSVHAIGLSELPPYARVLAQSPKFYLGEPNQVADVFWYPNQLDSRSAVSAARVLGHRVITTFLDLIAYDIDAYHAGIGEWMEYRSLQRKVALASDGITTISQDVATRICAGVPAIEPERVRAIPLGLDHIVPPRESADKPASLSKELAALAQRDRPFILVLGNDFLHKNRDLAIRVWAEILRQGVSCDLVLAGLHVHSSSSRRLEEALMSTHVDLRGNLITLGHVSEEERQWLLGHAALALYPTSAEGFGFIPYEAASLDTPSTFVGFGPLLEISGLSDLPRTWNSDALAADAIRMLTDEGAARERIAALQGRVAELTWDLFASRLVDFTTEIVELPRAATSLLDTSAPRDAHVPVTKKAGHLIRRISRRLRS